MSDLLSQLQGILSSEEGQSGLKQLAQLLGATAPPIPTPAATPAATASAPTAAASTATAPVPQTSPPVSPPPAPPAHDASLASPNGGGLADLLSGLDLSALSQLFSQMPSAPTSPTASDASSTKPATPAGSGNGLDLAGIDLGMIMKVQQMVQGMSQDDDNIRLLRALKPHCSESRQKKIDQAIQLLRLYTLLPMIKETGLLGGLLGDAEQ